MKSWKTTVGGLLAACGGFLTNSNPMGSWQNIAGQVLAGIGLVLLGGSAKDSNVTGGTKPQ